MARWERRDISSGCGCRARCNNPEIAWSTTTGSRDQSFGTFVANVSWYPLATTIGISGAESKRSRHPVTDPWTHVSFWNYFLGDTWRAGCFLAPPSTMGCGGRIRTSFSNRFWNSFSRQYKAWFMNISSFFRPIRRGCRSYLRFPAHKRRVRWSCLSSAVSMVRGFWNCSPFLTGCAH